LRFDLFFLKSKFKTPKSKKKKNAPPSTLPPPPQSSFDNVSSLQPGYVGWFSVTSWKKWKGTGREAVVRCGEFGVAMDAVDRGVVEDEGGGVRGWREVVEKEGEWIKVQGEERRVWTRYVNNDRRGYEVGERAFLERVWWYGEGNSGC